MRKKYWARSWIYQTINWINLNINLDSVAEVRCRSDFSILMLCSLSTLWKIVWLKFCIYRIKVNSIQLISDNIIFFDTVNSSKINVSWYCSKWTYKREKMRNIFKLCNDSSEREERNGAKTWKYQLWILTRKKCALAMCIKNLPTFSLFIDDDNDTRHSQLRKVFVFLFILYFSYWLLMPLLPIQRFSSTTL